MGNFAEALISKEKSSLIPEEYDYWGELIGSWNLDYVEGRGTEKEKHIKGEWYFERVLEGLGIQDIFICPAREERKDPKKRESFHWQNESTLKDGTLKIWCEVFATRQ